MLAKPPRPSTRRRPAWSDHGTLDLSARQGDQGREGPRPDRRRHPAHRRLPGQRFCQSQLPPSRDGRRRPIFSNAPSGGGSPPRSSVPAVRAWNRRRSCSSCTTRFSSPVLPAMRTGRNLHQRPLDEAVRFCNAITSITAYDKSVEEAFKIYTGDSRPVIFSAPGIRARAAPCAGP